MNESLYLEGSGWRWELPSFPLSGSYTRIRAFEGSQDLPDGTVERSYLFENSPARLKVQLRSAPRTGFTRIRFSLTGPDRFAGRDGVKPIRYGTLCFTDAACCLPEDTFLTEIQLSQFDRILHSFMPAQTGDTLRALEGQELIGPILMAEAGGNAVLAAYEHGAEAPDHFLAWFPHDDGIRLQSVKGNYYGGQPVESWPSPWIEIGVGTGMPMAHTGTGTSTPPDGTPMAHAGAGTRMTSALTGEAPDRSPAAHRLLRDYRRFLLEEMAPYGDSRKPLIFYNTWHVQEGKKYFRGDSYLKYMNNDFILRDIDIAHRMGVEVYVIDTGWFQKTGDWEVNERFFPDRMQAIREKLDAYGMRLGLWFNPIAAARTSQMYKTHPECVMSWNGEETYWGKIWETEESYGMCLASDYSDMFIETLVRLNRELGVSYFKWDAVGQYGCDSDGHHHGTKDNDPAERADVYAYQMGLQMIRIATEVSRRCPGAIVDFDVTEGGRCMGLGFLSAGKYFLINNGPYFHNFDIPDTVKMEPDTINVFFYPGAARPQICRQSAAFDPFVPSVLYLTHFFPHGSRLSRLNSMAALALGGNGIWGFLQEMDEEGIQDWAAFLAAYKEVREDVTAAYPLVKGRWGGSPEIHDKLNEKTCRGIVVFFTHGAGTFTYVTRRLLSLPGKITGADGYTQLNDGRIRLTVSLAEDEARVVFFT